MGDPVPGALPFELPGPRKAGPRGKQLKAERLQGPALQACGQLLRWLLAPHLLGTGPAALPPCRPANRRTWDWRTKVPLLGENF